MTLGRMLDANVRRRRNARRRRTARKFRHRGCLIFRGQTTTYGEGWLTSVAAPCGLSRAERGAGPSRIGPPGRPRRPAQLALRGG